MSSICGFYDLENKILIEKMAKIMKHRGPGKINYYSEKKCSLAQGMLNTKDSKKNPYPIQNEDGSIFLICDGEIYNSGESIKQLSEKHNFSTDTSTEVIIHLYEELGEDFLKETNGFDGEFAFALYDTKKRKLLLARDKIGLRPLYYSLINSKIFFASELKAILQYGEFKKKIDSSALNEYLTYTYIPAPKTIFKDSKKLPSAHYLIYDGKKVSVKEYWDLDFSKKIKAKEEFYSKKIYELLKDSVKRRLKGVKNPAVLLSGGLDSSSVAAIASLVGKRKVKTFSIGFEEKSYNELDNARIIAQHFNTDHHEFYVKSTDVKKILPKLVWAEDEPFADSSEIPTYYAAKLAKKYTNIVLGGDGGDDLFAGRLRRYKYHLLINKYLIGPKIIRNIIEKILSPKIIRHSVEKFFSFIPIVKELNGSENLWNEKGELVFSLPLEERHKKWLSPGFKEDMLKRVCKEKLEDGNCLKKCFKKCNAKNDLDKLLYLDMKLFSMGIFIKTNVCSSINSIAVLAPIFDSNLVNFSSSIPANLKIKGFKTKYIFKKAMLKILPKETLCKKKKGFSMPIGKWFREDLKEYTEQILFSEELKERGLFNIDYIKQLWREHQQENKDYSAELWILLKLELWFRIFMDNDIKI